MDLEISWLALIVPLLLWGAMTGTLCGLLTVEVFNDPHCCTPLSHAWSWRMALSVDAGCIASFLWPLWASYCAVHTVITGNYVSQPRLFGTTQIAWSQMEKITTCNRTITLQGSRDKITLSPFIYQAPQEVTAEIKRMADFHSIPADF